MRKRPRPGRPPGPTPTTKLGRQIVALRRWVGKAWGLETVVEQREALAQVLETSWASVRHWERSGRKPCFYYQARIDILAAHKAAGGDPPPEGDPRAVIRQKLAEAYAGLYPSMQAG